MSAHAPLIVVTEYVKVKGAAGPIFGMPEIVRNPPANWPFTPAGRPGIGRTILGASSILKIIGLTEDPSQTVSLILPETSVIVGLFLMVIALPANVSVVQVLDSLEVVIL